MEYNPIRPLRMERFEPLGLPLRLAPKVDNGYAEMLAALLTEPASPPAAQEDKPAAPKKAKAKTVKGDTATTSLSPSDGSLIQHTSVGAAIAANFQFFETLTGVVFDGASIEDFVTESPSWLTRAAAVLALAKSKYKHRHLPRQITLPSTTSVSGNVGGFEFLRELLREYMVYTDSSHGRELLRDFCASKLTDLQPGQVPKFTSATAERLRLEVYKKEREHDDEDSDF